MARPFEIARPSRVRQRYRRAELAGPGRVGAHARRQLREQQRRWLRARWHLILMVTASAGLVAVAIHAFVWKPVAPYVVGSVLASAGWWIYTMMLETGGLVSKRMGVAAEEWTASELRSLRKRGWRVVNHVMIQRADVDHALLGPGGFIALETKFRSDWPSAERNLGTMAWQAKRSARDLQARLGTWKPAVRPVVVMWGPDVRRHFAETFEHEEVTFCPGHLLREFIKSMPDTIGADDVAKAFTHLDEYVKKRDAGEVAVAGELPRTMAQVVQHALAVTASALLAAMAVLSPVGIRPAGLWSIVAAAVLVIGAVLTRRRWPRASRLQQVTASIIATSAGLGGLLATATLFFIAR